MTLYLVEITFLLKLKYMAYRDKPIIETIGHIIRSSLLSAFDDRDIKLLSNDGQYFYVEVILKGSTWFLNEGNILSGILANMCTNILPIEKININVSILNE